jgi:hypothetical protein
MQKAKCKSKNAQVNIGFARAALGYALRLLLGLALTATVFALQAIQEPLAPKQATELAELMCRQLPNVETILENTIVLPAASKAVAPVENPYVMDDVYDTLTSLGPYSVPCLVDRLTDARFMPDPRSEPLEGSPVVGDVAYMILMDKGVQDVLPELTHKKSKELLMHDYFTWPSVGDHRLRLQSAVRAWLLKHPNCCGTPPVLRKVSPSGVKFRMSATDLAKAHGRFSLLRPGMSPEQVLRIAGKPDAIEPGYLGAKDSSPSGSEYINLIGACAGDHNENLAYIYFTERWAEHIGWRDPLRDRYVILYFSAQGKFMHMFSNVADISPIFPSTAAVWQRLMWGEPLKKE